MNAGHSLVKRLAAVPDFAELSERTLLHIVGASTNLYWRAGSLIFEEGSDAEGLFIVITGEVQILSGNTEIATVGPDGFFGELALIRHAQHSRTARAIQDTELMVVRREWFEALLESDPELDAYFRKLFEDRIATFPDQDSIT